jgi:hypothetical protein
VDPHRKHAKTREENSAEKVMAEKEAARRVRAIQFLKGKES